MKIISMMLMDKEVARVTEQGIQVFLEMKSNHPFNFRQLYDDCFYGIANSKTFEERFDLAEKIITSATASRN